MVTTAMSSTAPVKSMTPEEFAKEFATQKRSAFTGLKQRLKDVQAQIAGAAHILEGREPDATESAALQDLHSEVHVIMENMSKVQAFPAPQPGAEGAGRQEALNQLQVLSSTAVQTNGQAAAPAPQAPAAQPISDGKPCKGHDNFIVEFQTRKRSTITTLKNQLKEVNANISRMSAEIGDREPNAAEQMALQKMQKQVQDVMANMSQVQRAQALPAGASPDQWYEALDQLQVVVAPSVAVLPMQPGSMQVVDPGQASSLLTAALPMANAVGQMGGVTPAFAFQPMSQAEFIMEFQKAKRSALSALKNKLNQLHAQIAEVNNQVTGRQADAAEQETLNGLYRHVEDVTAKLKKVQASSTLKHFNQGTSHQTRQEALFELGILGESGMPVSEEAAAKTSNAPWAGNGPESVAMMTQAEFLKEFQAQKRWGLSALKERLKDVQAQVTQMANSLSGRQTDPSEDAMLTAMRQQIQDITGNLSKGQGALPPHESAGAAERQLALSQFFMLTQIPEPTVNPDQVNHQQQFRGKGRGKHYDNPLAALGAEQAECSLHGKKRSINCLEPDPNEPNKLVCKQGFFCKGARGTR